MPTALISGISGQDGSYLAELLLDKGYQVHGLVLANELSSPALRIPRIQHLIDKLVLHPADLQDFESLNRLVKDIAPNECYHLAAQSSVSYSLENEFNTLNTNIHSTHNLLAAIKTSAPASRFFFAASSEIFGNVTSSPQDETTPCNPRSVYGITKTAGYFLVRNYRANHNLFACNGILYNHESERRGFEFVTRKITSGAAAIKFGRQKEIRLGNIEARRDWGYAPDYVSGMWQMLQQPRADDYILGTGETHTVREFLTVAFETLDLDWQKYVVIDPGLYRPAEPVEMRANPHKAQVSLGWKARIGFKDLVSRMVLSDLQQLMRPDPLNP